MLGSSVRAVGQASSIAISVRNSERRSHFVCPMARAGILARRYHAGFCDRRLLPASHPNGRHIAVRLGRERHDPGETTGRPRRAVQLPQVVVDQLRCSGPLSPLQVVCCLNRMTATDERASLKRDSAASGLPNSGHSSAQIPAGKSGPFFNGPHRLSGFCSVALGSSIDAYRPFPRGRGRRACRWSWTHWSGSGASAAVGGASWPLGLASRPAASSAAWVCGRGATASLLRSSATTAGCLLGPAGHCRPTGTFFWGHVTVTMRGH